MNPYDSAPLPSPQASPARPWWKTSPAALGMLALVALIGAFSFPLGFLALIAVVVLLWILPPWRWFAKLGANLGALVLLVLGSGLGGQLDESDAKPTAEATRTPSPKAPPSPAAEPEVPDYRGRPLHEAEAAARNSGYTTGLHDASAESRSILLRSDWVVCFQKADHDDGRKLIDFAAVKTGEPCPGKDGAEIPWPTMPDLLDETWRDSVRALTGLGVDEDAIEAESHYVNDELPGDHDTWRVCEQDPADGEDITAEVTLGLAHPDAGCSTTGLRLGDKDDDGRPDYRDLTDDRNTGPVGGSTSTGGPSSSGGGSSTGSGGSSTSGGGSSTSSGGSSTSGGGSSTSSGGSSTSGGGSSTSSGGSSTSGGGSSTSSGGSSTSSGGSSTSGGGSSTGSGGSSTGSGGSSTSGGGGASTVHPGSFCSPPGAVGVTRAGTPMVCGPGSDGRNRWRSG
ncbi:PASTA domain-containing protein [Streptomyces sp. LE64]|uniref:PASTA domain-containing protein n=1 Tax=Streptomyces sp. LE64 TaxID=3448653 RepID=UPI0040415883